jgi:flagellar M-ring protein FliF
MLQPVSGPSLTEILMRQFGTVINALTILALCAMMIWFGLRPAVRMLMARHQAELELQREQAAALAAAEAEEALEASKETALQVTSEADEQNLIEMPRTPQRKLEQIIELSEEQAAAVLKQWLGREAA